MIKNKLRKLLVKKMASSASERRKQSIIAGGLISSAGVFIAKFIGLFYVIPFNGMLATDANINYYGVAFTIYSYLLNISTAGFPFAVATLIARYASRGDYKTSILIRKLSTAVMAVFGFSIMVLMILFATPIASIVVSDPVDIENMRTVLIIISLALFFVPILSVMRGFYQGLKEMEVYALSQVLEQITRVAFLLGLSSFAVYVFKQDNIWAVYFGVLSTSVAAIAAIAHIKVYDRKAMKVIHKQADEQVVAHKQDKGLLLKELLFIAIPYLLSAILGYSDAIVNTAFMNNGLLAFGYSTENVTLITGAINYGIMKLLSIPMILAPGFSAAIIPYLTTALARNDQKLIRKNILECLDSVLYIAIPICFCLFIFAQPIYYVMFNVSGDKLAITSDVLRWYSIEAMLSTLGPIFTSLMMAVGLRKLNLRNLLLTVILKFMITYPLICMFGFQGAILSSMITMGIFMGLNAYAMSKRYHITWKITLRRMSVMLLGCIGIVVVGALMQVMGMRGYDVGRIQGTMELGISGFLSILVYFMITYAFHLPQTIFHIDIARIFKRGKRS